MDKKLKRNLKALFEVVLNEAEQNEEFAETLSNVFEKAEKPVNDRTTETTKRRTNRRDKAVLDPIKLAEEGSLDKDVLVALSDKELKDIIAEFKMDPSKLAMKWKDKNRVIELILETSFRRASKGDAFRS